MNVERFWPNCEREKDGWISICACNILWVLWMQKGKQSSANSHPFISRGITFVRIAETSVQGAMTFCKGSLCNTNLSYDCEDGSK